MPIASVPVPLAVSGILSPFLRHAKSWTLHYPIYLNTFCLAHHLAACFAEKRIKPDNIRHHFVRNDWWHGRPRFNYRSDIEIFVGVDRTIAQLEEDGHKIDVDQRVEFTKYNVSSIFQRLDKSGSVRPPSKKLSPILVTDVYTTAEEFRSGVKRGAIALPSGFTTADADRMKIRNAWDREIGDFFAENPKLYLFGAPMTHILMENSKGISGSPKYIKHDVAMPEIATYYVMRCNSPKSSTIISELGNAIRQYYDYIYDPQQAIDPLLPERYARIALTAGQANPFPEIYQFQRSAGPTPSTLPTVLTSRYQEILTRHHA